MQQPDERCATSPNTASGRRHVEVSIRTGCTGYIFDLRKELPRPGRPSAGGLAVDAQRCYSGDYSGICEHSMLFSG